MAFNLQIPNQIGFLWLIHLSQQLEVFSKAIGIRNRRNEILLLILPMQQLLITKQNVDFEVELARSLSVGPIKTSNDAHFAVASKNLPGKSI